LTDIAVTGELPEAKNDHAGKQLYTDAQGNPQWI
jgi:hypothetical protein